MLKMMTAADRELRPTATVIRYPYPRARQANAGETEGASSTADKNHQHKPTTDGRQLTNRCGHLRTHD
ncbi:MAG: hypothetical protein EOR02_33350 [Mesorhizobium sp.]|nr:MAG: hypothetical protein EOR02_33350 [Mesorhizobium sp.]